ncbi:hypothetical protein [uncultured Prevotella sp.]|nr:hypothetical protein [uncultured Prevotella sp.]
MIFVKIFYNTRIHRKRWFEKGEGVIHHVSNAQCSRLTATEKRV